MYNICNGKKMALTLTCSLLCNVATADAASTKLNDYNGQAVTAGGRTISYPVCSKKYPCRALAQVNGR